MRIRRVALSAIVALGLAFGLLWLLDATAPATDVAHASPSNRYVATTGSDTSNDCTDTLTPCATIQHAVDQATPDDEIRVAAGTYTGTNGYGGLSQVIYISKTVMVRGGYTTTNWAMPDPDANPTVVDAEGDGRVFYITGDISVTLEGLSITGGDATDQGAEPLNWGYDLGGGIYSITATTSISGCIIYSNTASTAHVAYGGGIFAAGGTAAINGCTIYSNTASTIYAGWGGGIHLYQCVVLLSDSNILGNRATTGMSYADPHTDCDGEGGGGGIVLIRCEADVVSNTVQNNIGCTERDRIGWGGGIYLSLSNVTVSNNLIVSNTASMGCDAQGGGLYVETSTATISSNQFLTNTASTLGMGVGGGAAFWSSEITLTHNTIQHNVASTGGYGSGGGLGLSEVTATLASNRILSNTACMGFGDIVTGPAAIGYGGGVLLYKSYADLNHNVIRGNVAATADISLPFPINGYGGGLYADRSRASLAANHILSNTANLGDEGWGGGLYLNGTGFTLTNNIVANNRVMNDGRGAGIYLHGSLNRLSHNTVSNNTGGDGSGFTILACDHFCQDNIFSFRNNIIVSQAVGIRIGENSTATVESNLWWNNGQDWDGMGTITTTNNYTGNPDFIPGLMDDHHIGPNSAALERGVDAGVTTDIDGDIRPLGGKPDLGADEYRYPMTILKEWYDLDGPPLQVGDSIQYATTVTNYSSQTMTGVMVTDTLPTGVGITSAKPPGYTGPDPLVWQISSLPASAIWTATITATVDGSTDPISGNVASVSSDQQEQVYTFPCGGGNVHCFAVNKTAQDITGMPLYEGNEIQYVISVTNECATPMAGVVVTDTLPAGVEFKSSIPSASTGPNPLVWQVGLLAGDEVWTATVSVEVDGTSNPIGGNVVVVGNAEGEELETEPIFPPGGGNIEPGLGIEKTAEDMNGFPLHIDDPIQYVITVTNQSGATGVSGVVVTDTLPAGVTFLSATSAYSGPNPLVWDLGDLAASEVWTAGVTVKVNGAANPIGGNVVLAKGRQTLEVTTDPILPIGGGALEASPSGYLPLVVHK